VKRQSKHDMIADLANRGMTKRQAYNELKPLVESQIEPMVFKANPTEKGGRRIPKPLGEQYKELKNQIGRSYQLIGRSVSSDFESEEIEQEQEKEIAADACDKCGKSGVELFHDEESGDSLCEDCLPREQEQEKDEKPQAKGKKRILSELQYFEKRKEEIRAFCKQREEMSEPLDDLDTVRPEQAASRLIPAGIPADALLASMVMHWPKDARLDANVADFDFVSLSQEIMDSRKIRGVDGETAHELFGYALVLAECRQPIWLIGPKGTGKSHLAKQLARFLELKYGETPMTPGATRGDLLGRHTIGGFIPAQFCVIYSGGGVFNFEEMDAADPSMLIVLNNALASDTLFNSANGEEYERSSNFIALATANTFGLGANRQYTGRERLDDATLDRWRMGRIFVHRDPKVAKGILYQSV
jgi:AAA domain (dynein-related subfamily)